MQTAVGRNVLDVLVREVSRFTQCCFEPDDVVEIRVGNEIAWHTAAELTEPKTLASLYGANQSGKNITVGINPRTHKGAGASTPRWKSHVEHIACARCLFAAWATWTHSMWLFRDVSVWHADVKRRCSQAGLPEPTIVISGGSDSRPAWRLKEPIRDMATWKRFQGEISGAIALAQCSFSAKHAIALPGFACHASNRPSLMCKILSADPKLRYDADSLKKNATGRYSHPDETPHVPQCPYRGGTGCLSPTADCTDCYPS